MISSRDPCYARSPSDSLNDSLTINESRAPDVFLLCSMAVLWGSCVIAIGFPIQCSMIAVFALAGPHNWMEARYFLSRHPARWGKLRPFFLLSIIGIFGLTIGFASIPWFGESFHWSHEIWLYALGLWNLALIGWVYLLVTVRSRQPPRRDWVWAAPIALASAGVAVMLPGQMSVLWIYLHPLVGLWILDREILRCRPYFSTQYRACVAMIPFAVLSIALTSYGQKVGTRDPIAEQIVAHSGTAWVPWLSSSLLVSVHAFLELIHYGVWLIAIPLVTARVWRPVSETVPLAKRSPIHRRAVLGLLVAGFAAVIVLWVGFQIDYVTTRDLYFTVAMVHVLAEVPFLLRCL